MSAEGPPALRPPICMADMADSIFDVRYSKFKVQSSRFKVQGSEFRVRRRSANLSGGFAEGPPIFLADSPKVRQSFWRIRYSIYGF
jgi:hypothetical protein